MDDYRSPSVTTLLGVTFGLLVFDWMVITFVGVRSLAFRDALWTSLIYSYYSGPIGMFMLTAWLGRRRRELLEHCLKYALLFAVFAALLALVAVLAPTQLDLMFMTFCGAFLVWLTAWPFGILALASTLRPDHPEPSDESE